MGFPERVLMTRASGTGGDEASDRARADNGYPQDAI